MKEQRGLTTAFTQFEGTVVGDRTSMHVVPVAPVDAGATPASTLSTLAQRVQRLSDSPSLESAGRDFLTLLRECIPELANAAFYSQNDGPEKALKPEAALVFDRRAGSHHISRRMLLEAIETRRGTAQEIQLPAGVPLKGVTSALPMSVGAWSQHVVHLELWTVDAQRAWACLGLAEQIIGLCSPAFEALSLRLQLDQMLTGFVKTINAAIGAKDTYTVGHSERVAAYSMAVGDELALDKETRQFLFVSALCHDIGKIGVPDEILKNPGLLSAEDFEEMKMHPSIGASLIQHLPQRAAIESGIKHHHERFDGTGYPDGLEGEKIPLFGRIVAVADAFDAMTSGRSYSGYMTDEEAVNALMAKDDLFDPQILRSFKNSFERGQLNRRSGTNIRGKAAV